MRSIGWDVAITETGPYMLEGNDNWCMTLFSCPAEKGCGIWPIRFAICFLFMNNIQAIMHIRDVFSVSGLLLIQIGHASNENGLSENHFSGSPSSLGSKNRGSMIFFIPDLPLKHGIG